MPTQWDQIRHQLSRPFQRTIDEKSRLETISRGTHLKNLRAHPGWAILVSYMETERKLVHKQLEQTTANITLWNLVTLFNLFVKYMSGVIQTRSYRKLQGYIEGQILLAEKYTNLQIKEEKREN